MQSQSFIYQATLKVVSNLEKEQIDFIIHQPDQHFQQLLSSAFDSATDLLFSKVFPPHKLSESNARVKLENLLQQGSVQTLQLYSPGLKSHFRVQAIVGDKDLISAYFVDNSAEKRYERQLDERRKEFKAILMLSELDDIELPTSEMLSSLVKKIPESWQYPEHTYCRVVLNEKEFRSENYRNTEWKLQNEIQSNGEKFGIIEVGYLKAFPEEDIGPFYDEEKILLKEIAERLSKILERRSIFKKLQNTQSLMEKASDMAEMGAWSVDLSTQVVEWSDQVAKIHGRPQGYKPDVSEGISYYAPEWQDRISKVFKKCAEEGESYNEEMEIITAKGKRRWVRTMGEAVRDEHNNIVKVQGAFQDITDILETKQALEDTEEQFRQIFYNHTAVKLIIDPETGRIVFANKAAEAFYGRSAGELEKMRINDINILSSNSIQKKMRGVVDGSDSHFEFKHKKADGTICDVEVFTSKVVINDSEYLHSIIHDVTEKREAERALIKSEKKLNAMFTASPIAIFSISPDGFVQTWNKASERIFGWTEKEVIGEKLPIVPDHLQDEYQKLRKRALAGESLTELELKRQRKDGSTVDVSLSTAPITDEEERIISILAMASDISERKKKDEQLLLQSAALDSAANAIVITDKDGKIEWINDAWSELTGYDEHEVLGENPRILKSGIQGESFYEELWDTILSGDVWRGELVNERKDGTYYHEFQTITPLVDENDTVKHFIGIKQDITKRKEIEEELRELLREKDILLSEIHHRVKNNMALLSAILYLELMQTDNNELTDHIHNTIHRISTITAVHEMVYQTENWTKVNLKEIVRRIIKSVGERVERDCNIQIIFESAPVNINVNQALPASLIINEVIMSIYRTACRQERSARIKIRALEDHRKVRVSIIETSNGGPANVSELKEALGMQLINTLTQQLQGIIQFDNKEEETSFSLLFERDDSLIGAANAYMQ